MSRQIIIIDSDSDSEDSIPSPSPFSPQYRRPRPPEQQQGAAALPSPAKRQRVSVLEQQEEDDDDEESLSEPSDQKRNGVLERQAEAHKDNQESLSEPASANNDRESRAALPVEQEAAVDEESNSLSVLERVGAGASTVPQSVSDEDRKQPAKETTPTQRPNEQKIRGASSLSHDTLKAGISQAPTQRPNEQKVRDAPSLSRDTSKKTSSQVPTQRPHEQRPSDATIRSKDTSKDEVVSAPQKSRGEATSSPGNDTSKDEVVSEHVSLEEIPSLPPLEPLNETELKGLKLALQFNPNDPDDEWPMEWSGNIGILTMDVPNPLAEDKTNKGDERMLVSWAETSAGNLSLARGLLRYVYNESSTPPTAKRILSHAFHESLRDPKYDMEPAMRRISFDPAVLREDGWTTARSAEPIGATGGPHHIGARVVWQRWEGVVIAYLHDDDIGDLWKAMWLDGNETFDLEAGELQDARKKWERKMKQSETVLTAQPSVRFASAEKFTVEGIENGIILAKSYDPRARHGLFWPARVVHASDLHQFQQSQSRRSSAKNKLQVFFLAPYWNGEALNSSRLALADSLSLGTSAFSSGHLVEPDTVEISDETIQPYPYGHMGENGLNIDELQVAFRFTGLPKNAFPRFLDSHRLALALRTYAQQELKSTCRTTASAAAALTDTHALANETAKFPPALLHLPFEYILSKLPRSIEKDSLTMGLSEDNIEPTIQLRHMMQSMEPPRCWGQEAGSPMKNGSPLNSQRIMPALSAALESQAAKRQLDVNTSSNGNMSSAITLKDVASEYLVQALSHGCSSASMASKLLDQLKDLLTRLGQEISALDDLGMTRRRDKLQRFLRACLRTKGQGEDVICSEEFDHVVSAKALLTEWRKACENIFRRASVLFSCSDFGNATTYVISDSRCNEHITSSGCVERPVRIPAALKGARLAATTTGRHVDFLLSVGDDYMNQAEMKVIGMAHSSTYLKRIRAKCAAIDPGTSGVPLTDDSNSEGGEDTKGSRGTYTAAVAGVAAAMKAVDMICGGQAVNAFCATRPPGHHAGRELHPMKAISNGFCILNSAACAALYATTPISEHGPGLKRVCVIDIDVHHGNGTQNVLCETYDPRFLYISLHAGGAHINGHEAEDDEYRAIIGSQQKEDAIFPGRCGDTSPHKGVLNIPLGARVKPQDMGMALATQVGPAVSKFAPDLIVVSAGFDAHKHDPLGMGGLSAEDFGRLTDVICSMANKCCSGRVLSILEGGYGVPCCRPQKDLFLPLDDSRFDQSQESSVQSAYEASDNEFGLRESQPQPQQQSQVELLDLGGDIPDEMEDQVPQNMHKTLNRCKAEGFVDCVREHVGSLAKSNDRSKL